MNRNRITFLIVSLFLVLVANAGCDLGTYNARFEERNNPRTVSPDETEAASSDEEAR